MVSPSTNIKRAKILKIQTKISLIQGAILGCANLLATPSYAGAEAILDLLKILRDRGTISQDEFEALRHAARVDEEEQASEQEQPQKEITEANQNSIKITTDYKGLMLESIDGAFKFNLGGQLQVDANVFDEDHTDLESGTEIRRARLHVEGTMWRVWDYKFQLDFAGDEATIKDAYIRFTGFEPISITLGHQKVPFSLQSMTSSNWQVFQERALMDGFIDNNVMDRRHLGFTIGAHRNHWTANAGLFGEGVDAADQSGENWGAAGRVTFAPIAEATCVLHFGGAAYYRNFDHDPELAFSVRPEAHIAPRLISTSAIFGGEEVLLLGGEISTVWSSFHAQGEYVHAGVGRKNGLSNPDFDGWYVQAGYFLTGESRSYEVERGRYGRIIPNRIVGQGGQGAWEVAFRYSTLDLTDSGILGGTENNFTVALNWYATPSIMFRANYIRAETDPDSIVTGVGIAEDINIYTLRAQVVF